MSSSIFRGYDIRGKVGSELELDSVYDIGCAIGYFLSLFNDNIGIKNIAICYDSRIDSEYIHKEITNALIDSGFNVISISMGPTPLLQFCLHTMAIDVGIMITASHNPKEYNGIKIFLKNGPIWSNQIQEIEKYFSEKKRVFSLNMGKLSTISIHAKYTHWLATQFSHLKNFEAPFIINCLNGASSSIIKDLVDIFQWRNCTLINNEVAIDFKGKEPDPTNKCNKEETYIKMQETNSEFAISFDGDADRMVPSLNDGSILYGDKVLAIFANYMAKREPLLKVVYDIKCSENLKNLLLQIGAQPIVTKTGHAFIKSEMKKHGALIGAELSGHIFFADRYFGVDDAIYAALRLLEIIYVTESSLKELSSIIENNYCTDEVRIEYNPSKKQEIYNKAYSFFAAKKDTSLCTIDGVKASTQDGWGLIRFSNTQPVISLRFESKTQDGLDKIKHEFVQILKDEIGESANKILIQDV